MSILSFGSGYPVKPLIHRLTNLALNLGMGWVIVMMIITTLDVAGRYFFSKPLPGTMEMSSFMLAIFAILGMAHTQRRGANVRVTMVIRILPYPVAAIFEILTSILTFQVVGMLSWYGLVMGIEDFHAGTTTDTLSIPLYPLQFLLALGAMLLALEILVNIGESLNNLFQSEKHP